MADKTTRDDRLDKEPAEGSRKTVDDALENREQGPVGITNRPLDEERESQAEVPPRGEKKDSR